eukprot:Hpha_TRINITY_DN4699_c0_g1::TRINITY_DN4699_c0_g1_i1::g.97173::m.97173
MVCAMARAAALLGVVAAVHGKTFRFTALGDWGMGGVYAGNCAEVLSAQSYHHVAAEFDTQFVINVGDQLYMPDVGTGIQQSFYSTWIQKGAHKGGVWFCVRGNHDNHVPQMQHTRVNPNWWFPAEHFTRTVDTNLGFGIQIWALDSNSGGGPGWLERSLGASKARWKFFTTHFPYINSGRHKRVPAPTHFANIAKRYGVQIVFCGHDHIVQVCVQQGVLFITTGATSRGAMMARPVDADKTHFVYTMGVKTSIGNHGITQFEVTKNVIWGSIHGHQSMVYEFTSVWDWPTKFSRYRSFRQTGRLSGGVSVGSDSRLPPRSVILQYLQEEADSPAPGAGNASSDDTPATPAPPQTSSPSRPVDTSPEHEKKQLEEEKKEQAEEAQKADAQVTAMPTPPEGLRGATYVVASECKLCVGPSVNQPFTLWVQGVPTDEKHNVFLAYSSSACQAADLVGAVGGENSVRVLTEAVQRFTPRGELTESVPVFVCVSQDGGKTYAAIPQGDSGVLAFTLYPEPPVRAGENEDPKGMRGNTAVKNHGYNRPGNVELRLPSLPDSSRSDSSSNGVLWFIVMLLIIAIPVAWNMGRARGRNDLGG